MQTITRGRGRGGSSLPRDRGPHQRPRVQRPTTPRHIPTRRRRQPLRPVDTRRRISPRPRPPYARGPGEPVSSGYRKERTKTGGGRGGRRVAGGAASGWRRVRRSGGSGAGVCSRGEAGTRRGRRGFSQHALQMAAKPAPTVMMSTHGADGRPVSPRRSSRSRRRRPGGAPRPVAPRSALDTVSRSRGAGAGAAGA
jgi:hypothetical protein